MKPVFKCDYCEFMGTEDEVRYHENEDCYYNYTKRSCTTCTHKKTYFSKEIITSGFCYKCDCGIELPEGKMMVNCKSYERNEKKSDFDDVFGGLFGGLK